MIEVCLPYEATQVCREHLYVIRIINLAPHVMWMDVLAVKEISKHSSGDILVIENDHFDC